MWIFLSFFFFGGLMLFLFDDRPIRYIYIFLIYSLPKKIQFFFKPWSTLPLVVSLSFFSQSDLIEFEDKELDELQYHTFFFFFENKVGQTYWSLKRTNIKSYITSVVWFNKLVYFVTYPGSQPYIIDYQTHRVKNKLPLNNSLNLYSFIDTNKDLILKWMSFIIWSADFQKIF